MTDDASDRFHDIMDDMSLGNKVAGAALDLALLVIGLVLMIALVFGFTGGYIAP